MWCSMAGRVKCMQKQIFKKVDLHSFDCATTICVNWCFGESKVQFLTLNINVRHKSNHINDSNCGLFTAKGKRIIDVKLKPFIGKQLSVI